VLQEFGAQFLFSKMTEEAKASKLSSAAAEGQFKTYESMIQ
jgi:hypothetical protein